MLQKMFFDCSQHPSVLESNLFSLSKLLEVYECTYESYEAPELCKVVCKGKEFIVAHSNCVLYDLTGTNSLFNSLLSRNGLEATDCAHLEVLNEQNEFTTLYQVPDLHDTIQPIEVSTSSSLMKELTIPTDTILDARLCSTGFSSKFFYMCFKTQEGWGAAELHDCPDICSKFLQFTPFHTFHCESSTGVEGRSFVADEYIEGKSESVTCLYSTTMNSGNMTYMANKCIFQQKNQRICTIKKCAVDLSLGSRIS